MLPIRRWPAASAGAGDPGVNDVKLLPSQAASRPAAVNDEVKQGTAVRTGTNSRTELTFTDLTITRLGANTVFSFRPGTRDLKINAGALLIQIPPGAPEVKVSTAAVSAAISGGTAIFDAATGKFMILEGIGGMWPIQHPELATIVHAGEIRSRPSRQGLRPSGAGYFAIFEGEPADGFEPTTC